MIQDNSIYRPPRLLRPHLLQQCSFRRLLRARSHQLQALMLHAVLDSCSDKAASISPCSSCSVLDSFASSPSTICNMVSELSQVVSVILTSSTFSRALP